MDKFGVFNLINSFLNYYNNSNSSEKTKTDSDPKPLEKTLGSLFNSKKPEKIEKPNSLPPIKGLYNAMSSHDEFVKRVLKNSTKKP